jgi:hypothetical protein
MAKLTVIDPRRDIPPIVVTSGVVIVQRDNQGMITVSLYERGVTKPIAYPAGDIQVRVEA